MLGDFFMMKYGALADKVSTKHSQIIDADEILRKDEIMQKDEIDFGTWRVEMKVGFCIKYFLII
jgi:hypothetical protein